MFPGQQCATWPAQLWPPRLGIKLLEGAPSTEKWRKGVYFRIPSQKIGAISLVFAQWVERAQSGHINPATPVRGVVESHRTPDTAVTSDWAVWADAPWMLDISGDA